MRVRAIRDHFDGTLRKAGEEFESCGELSDHVAPLFDRDQLRERFHRVVIGAGYSELAAQSILERWLETYLQDVRAFTERLERYENSADDARTNSA
jgi:hypothetical protein